MRTKAVGQYLGSSEEGSGQGGVGHGTACPKGGG